MVVARKILVFEIFRDLMSDPAPKEKKEDLGAAEPLVLLKIGAIIGVLAIIFYLGLVFFPEPTEPLADK